MGTEQLKPVEHQVGGHGLGQVKNGFLTSKTKLYKPFQTGKRGQAEKNFYEKINFAEHEKYQQLLTFVPKYFGVEVLHENGCNGTHQNGHSLNHHDDEDNDEFKYIVLEDLTNPFSKPSIMDLKIGTVTWGEDAPPHVVEYRKQKE